MDENNFVLDTHVWISIFHKNRNEKLLNAVIENDITLISTLEQEKELLDAITKHTSLKHLLPKAPEKYSSFLRSVTFNFPSSKRFTLLTDHKDNYLVDLAWQSNSTLVSDDATFGFLKRLSRPKVKLISKKEFYNILGW